MPRRREVKTSITVVSGRSGARAGHGGELSRGLLARRVLSRDASTPLARMKRRTSSLATVSTSAGVPCATTRAPDEHGDLVGDVEGADHVG
ncbi:MAG: hypothetical protein U0326_06015 [Polyangiales bacterium]